MIFSLLEFSKSTSWIKPLCFFSPLPVFQNLQGTLHIKYQLLSSFIYVSVLTSCIPSTSKSLHLPFPPSFNCYYDLINLSCFLLHPLYLLLHMFSALASSEFFPFVLTTNHVFILPQNISPISLTLEYQILLSIYLKEQFGLRNISSTPIIHYVNSYSLNPALNSMDTLMRKWIMIF